MGVRLVNLGEGQSLVAIARNAEETAAETGETGAVGETADATQSATDETEDTDSE
jgi:hypothetical protein